MTSQFGPFTLDTARRQLTRDGGEVHLTPKAFELLVLLVQEAPRVVRKDELHERLWPGTFVSDATLVSLVKEVRRAIGDRSETTPIIRTAHRVGYAFVAPLKRVAPRASISWWVVVGSRRIPLAAGENLIGRDPAATVCLDAAGVSRRHARIVIEERNAVLEDLGSKNGTAVGDRSVAGSIPLSDGDEIRIGPVVMLCRSSTSGLSTETLSLDAVTHAKSARQAQKQG